jgi:phosphoribosyl 1,2-cyclic phosphodiesterase
MIYISFASGSSGNCALLREGGTSLLLDAGISMRRLKGCLADFGVELSGLAGILITHEHSDHIGGLVTLTKHYNIPLYASGGTLRALLRGQKCRESNLHAIEAESRFRLGDIEVAAFETPHDAAESLGFVFTGGKGSLGVATDLGCVTRPIERALSCCAAAVLEANHAVDMLRFGPYPQALKARILGRPRPSVKRRLRRPCHKACRGGNAADYAGAPQPQKQYAAACIWRRIVKAGPRL